MATKLYVGNLSFRTTSEELREAFAAVGTVESASVIEDRETGRSRGFAFVEMATPEEATAAIEAFNGKDFGGRNLTVNEAKPRTDRGGGGRGGYGGNRGGAAFSPLTTKRFTGQYHEQSLPGGEGLSYYGARWYDAQLGRFTGPDTLVPGPGNPQAFNRYSYVFNHPLRKQIENHSFLGIMYTVWQGRDFDKNLQARRQS